MKAKPLRDRIIVLQDDVREDVTSAGIVSMASKSMVESQKQLGRRGTVQAVGEAVHDLKRGDRVLYGEFLHQIYREGGINYIVLQEADIVGVIE